VPTEREDLLHTLLSLAGVPEEGALQGDYVKESAYKALVLTALTTDFEGNPKGEWNRPLPDDKLTRRVAFVALRHLTSVMEQLAQVEDPGLKGALGRLRGVIASLEATASPAIIEELRAVEGTLAGHVGEVTAWDRIASDD